jgi:hypothetical protein
MFDTSVNTWYTSCIIVAYIETASKYTVLIEMCLIITKVLSNPLLACNFQKPVNHVIFLHSACHKIHIKYI